MKMALDSSQIFQATLSTQHRVKIQIEFSLLHPSMQSLVDYFEGINLFFTFYVHFSPVLAVGRCLHCRTFCWSGEPFYVRMPFLTTTKMMLVSGLELSTFRSKVRPATSTPRQAQNHRYFNRKQYRYLHLIPRKLNQFLNRMKALCLVKGPEASR